MRSARWLPLLGVLLAGWLLLASTPAAGGAGGSPADDLAADAITAVGQAAERVPGPTALPRQTPWAAVAAAIAVVVLTATIERLRPARVPVRIRLLVGSAAGRAPPALTS